jgi:hypothetical protein
MRRRRSALRRNGTSRPLPTDDQATGTQLRPPKAGVVLYIMTEDESVTGKPRRGGSALAVDLRRARAARRREEKAAEAAATLQPKPSNPSPTIICADREPIDCVREWFRSEGWEPFEFQEEVWRAYLAGESGLIHAATGTGKTYAAWIGPILKWLRDYPAGRVARNPGVRPQRVAGQRPRHCEFSG